MIGVILVGVDGSQDSRTALEWAAGLASQLDAEVLAVHALGLLDRLVPDADPVPSASHRDEITKVFETEWCAPLDAAGVRSRRIVENGPPSMVLLRVVEAEAVDLIVVGSRGLGGFEGLLLGSTSHQLAQHAPVPVAIIPGPARGDGNGPAAAG